ncbi:MAG: NADH-quinone oxidoreductase subunit M [Candidatus Riesia sp.]|nr:NADH-quinone oxidoreductase subunit M [Candidatus Riesia sp.]
MFFFFGFATKIPLVPLHTWLPEAHVEAPTPGSMILAGLLLKIGTFGMLRFMFPLLIEVNIFCRPFAFLMALISIYHASFIALRQVDFKKIIAYSSISHMGFVILGLFSMNLYGLLGSLFIMFSHGIVASTLFFLVGILYDRYKVRNILYYGGLTNVMPIFVVVFFFFILANLSFPGTSNFVGELIVLFGLIEINFFTTILSTFSIIFTAIYSI